jgi:hypothetical protein
MTTVGTWRRRERAGKNSRLLKNAHLLRFPHPSSLRRTSKYASLLGISEALHLGIFEQPGTNHFFSNLLDDLRFRSDPCFHRGIGAVVMDGFEILGFDRKPGDIGVLF